jgi:hypothetical protein
MVCALPTALSVSTWSLLLSAWVAARLVNPRRKSRGHITRWKTGVELFGGALGSRLVGYRIVVVQRPVRAGAWDARRLDALEGDASWTAPPLDLKQVRDRAPVAEPGRAPMAGATGG